MAEPVDNGSTLDASAFKLKDTVSTQEHEDGILAQISELLKLPPSEDTRQQIEAALLLQKDPTYRSVVRGLLTAKYRVFQTNEGLSLELKDAEVIKVPENGIDKTKADMDIVVNKLVTFLKEPKPPSFKDAREQSEYFQKRLSELNRFTVLISALSVRLYGQLQRMNQSSAYANEMSALLEPVRTWIYLGKTTEERLASQTSVHVNTTNASAQEATAALEGGATGIANTINERFTKGLKDTLERCSALKARIDSQQTTWDQEKAETDAIISGLRSYGNMNANILTPDEILNLSKEDLTRAEKVTSQLRFLKIIA